MFAVGFSASAAMSTVQATVVIGFIGSLIFATAAIGLFLLVVPVGFASMLRHGLGVENSPTLWMTVPIVTLLGIMFMRDFHGFATLSGFAGAEQPGTATLVPFVMLTVLLAFQTVVFMFGKAAMNRNGYLRRSVYSREASAGSFGLVCPGVAYGVLGFFWLHAGLVGAGIVERNSAVYFAILAGLFAVQIVTIAGTLKLVSNNLLTRRTPAAATAGTAAEAPAQVPAQASFCPAETDRLTGPGASMCVEYHIDDSRCGTQRLPNPVSCALSTTLSTLDVVLGVDSDGKAAASHRSRCTQRGSMRNTTGLEDLPHGMH